MPNWSERILPNAVSVSHRGFPAEKDFLLLEQSLEAVYAKEVYKQLRESCDLPSKIPVMVSAPCLMQHVEYILKLFLVIHVRGESVHMCAGALEAKSGPQIL